VGKYLGYDGGKPAGIEIDVSQKDGKYYMTEVDGSTSHPIPDPVVPFTKDDFRAFFGEPAPTDFDGIQASAIAVVKVSKGWSDHTHAISAKTGYLLLLPIGVLELRKE